MSATDTIPEDIRLLPTSQLFEELTLYVLILSKRDAASPATQRHEMTRRDKLRAELNERLPARR